MEVSVETEKILKLEEEIRKREDILNKLNAEIRTLKEELKKKDDQQTATGGPLEDDTNPIKAHGSMAVEEYSLSQSDDKALSDQSVIVIESSSSEEDCGTATETKVQVKEPILTGQSEPIISLESEVPSSDLDSTVSTQDEPANITLTTESSFDEQQLCLSPEVTQLQDHLRRMEESQYSTHEELQATLQELSDLQTQLDQTRCEREKFREEKRLLLESLYRQTERLQAARVENENVQKLLHESAGDHSVPDREKKLLELLKQGQAKRETLITQNNELNKKLFEIQRAKEMTDEEIRCLTERVRVLEVTVEDLQYEKKLIEEELSSLKFNESNTTFEILRLNVLLELEESKVKELRTAQESLGNDNELCNLMNNILKDKDIMEKQHAESQDVLKRKESEVKKLNLQISVLEDEVNVQNKKAANACAELEKYSEFRNAERQRAEKEQDEMRKKINDMEKDNEELARDLRLTLDSLKITENQLQVTHSQLEELEVMHFKDKIKRDNESAEWKQLHEDLLIAVRVANEIKMEFQEELEKAQCRVSELEESNAALRAQGGTKKEKVSLKPEVMKPPNIPKVPVFLQPAVPAVAKEPSFNRYSRPSLQCVNVKSLIESIENKTGQQDSSSGSKAGSPQRETPPPLPLREQPLTSNRQTQQTPPVISELTTPPDEKKDALHSLVERNGGSKRNALLKWVQSRIQGYPHIEITNFSSSWTDGLALCALLHSYIPLKIPYYMLTPHNRQQNFSLAFKAAEAVGIPTILNMNDMTQHERPDWQKVMAYVKEIYMHFEGRNTN